MTSAGHDSPQLLTVDGDKSVSASFATLYDVSLSLTGPGTLTLDPPGGSYPAGTVVSVSATPDDGAVFGGFGGDLSGTDSPQLLTVDGDKSVSASFGPASYTLSVTSSGSGTVTLDPPGGVYAAGATVTLRAAPASGFFFGGWSGDASGSRSPLLRRDGRGRLHPWAVQRRLERRGLRRRARARGAAAPARLAARPAAELRSRT